MSDLPQGWANAKLGELAERITKGSTPTSYGFKYQSQGIAFVKVENLANGLIDHASIRDRINDEAHQSQARSVLQAGDVLFSIAGTIGETCLVRSEDLPANTNQALAIIRGTASLLNPRYLQLVLSEAVARQANEEKARGGGMNNVSLGDVAEFSVPLPPFPEQKRIVAKVEALLAEVNAARERLERVPAILKRFRKSVLAAACSGRLTEDWRSRNVEIEGITSALSRLAASTGKVKVRRGVPSTVSVPDSMQDLELPSTWAGVSVAELLRTGALVDVKDGNHGSNHPKSAEFTSEGTPFITAAQVNDFWVDYEGAPKVSGKPLEKLRVGFAQPGDTLLTHKGSIGRSALNTKPCVLTPQTTYYRCNDSVVDARYLMYQFASVYFYQQLAAVMSQTTRDFVPISEQYSLFVILPPIAEQRAVVSRVDALLSTSSKIETHYLSSSSRVGSIGQSILAKAFRGELVPTEAELARAEGREYESAAQLLARVQAQREAHEPLKAGKRKKGGTASEAPRKPRRRALTG